MATFMPVSKMPVQNLSPINGQAQPQYEITDADKKRQKKICDAWCAYTGDLDPPLQKMPGQPDDNVLTNRMMAIVDQGVNFLFGKELEITVEVDAPKEARDCLNKTWGRKEARIPLLQKLAMSGALAGQAFLRIVPEPNGTYRLIVVDPATVFVQTAPQDCETVLIWCIEYSTNEKRNGKWEQIYYREEISRIDPDHDGDSGNPFADVDATWRIQHWSRVGERGLWTAAGEPIMWSYSFPPIFTCQNLPNPHDFWGFPDVSPDLIGVNQALNLVQSCVNRILKLYGSPILYATGTGEQVIDIKPGKIISLPLTESKITAVTLASDVANALAFAENLRSDIDEQSAVPGIATGRIVAMPRGQLSGIAIELLFMPLLKKTEKKQCLYGEIIINVSKALLVLNGMSGDLDIELAWQNPIPHDDLQSAQFSVLLKQIGISDSTIQRNLGFDPDEEAKLNAEEDVRGQGMSSRSFATANAPMPHGAQAPGQGMQGGGNGEG